MIHLLLLTWLALPADASLVAAARETKSLLSADPAASAALARARAIVDEIEADQVMPAWCRERGEYRLMKVSVLAAEVGLAPVDLLEPEAVYGVIQHPLMPEFIVQHRIFAPRAQAYHHAAVALSRTRSGQPSLADRGEAIIAAHRAGLDITEVLRKLDDCASRNSFTRPLMCSSLAVSDFVPRAP